MDDIDMSNSPTSRPISAPALSLTLGIFPDGGGAPAAEAETTVETEEADGGRTRREELTVEISSENSGPTKSRSEEDVEGDADLDGDGGDTNKSQKRKRYHRHTAEQIREMEALFKESPHPDDKQRQELSKQLGLAPRQVKFWFQNRRTQLKAIQERHETMLLKNEMEKLQEENKKLRETIKKTCCPNCGFAFSNKDSSIVTGEQQLRLENARLKAEIEKLRAAVGKYNLGTPSASSSSSTRTDQDSNRSSLELFSGFFGLQKSRVTEIADQAVKELVKMASASEPLWIRSVETGREILNYDEYRKLFLVNNLQAKGCIEASRETGAVFVDLSCLVQSFMDVNRWKEMFSSMVSRATTVDVIKNGEGPNRNGGIQMMFAELQMLTPMVPTREVYFVRHCKQISANQWVIVDFSVDKVEDDIDKTLAKCRKRASGCIIEEKGNGHCKVIWVEHLECQKATVPATYRAIVNSGTAFGARRWVATLQQQCERLVFVMATNIPMKDSSSVATVTGRKSVFKLAQRMTRSFCQALGASSRIKWTKVTSKTGDDIRISSRNNINDPGEPLGMIVCAVSSVWLPVSHHVLFDFLRDEERRREWDVMASGVSAQSVTSLAKGQDRGNVVAIQTLTSRDSSMWILQDSCTNIYESMVVYAPVDIKGMQSVMTGCDSSDVAILPSGFSILPDGLESRSSVITSKPEEKSAEGGSLLTIALQILTNTSPTAQLTPESVESATTLISCTLQNIKASLQCEDG